MNRLTASPYAPAALLLAMATIAALVLGGYSYQLAERGRAEAQAQQRALDQARGRYQRSGDERDLLTRYVPQYHALAGHGFVGSEQRVDWIDSLRAANEATGLFGVQYQIGAQTPYLLPQLPTAGLAQSPMKVEFRLVHEGDLMRFLRALARERAGVFTINECTLERIIAADPGLQVQPNLRAECELAWISVPRAGGAPR